MRENLGFLVPKEKGKRSLNSTLLRTHRIWGKNKGRGFRRASVLSKRKVCPDKREKKDESEEE